tara:strand:- start:69 stop:365 length:297 start_codon:yes stop_codon:yes gene_type:complete
MKKKLRPSEFKLAKLKEIRQKNLEKNLLDVQLKGQDHYIFINERQKACLVSDQKGWVSEHIKTAILKYNYQIDKIPNLLVGDFTNSELAEFEKSYLQN